MSTRARIIVDAFGFAPLRIGEGLHVRQRRNRSRVFVCFLVEAGCGARWISGPKPTPRTMANAKAVADRRYCGERRA